MPLNFSSSCLQILSVRAAGVCHHALCMWCQGWAESFMHARQALYQLGHVLSPVTGSLFQLPLPGLGCCHSSALEGDLGSLQSTLLFAPLGKHNTYGGILPTDDCLWQVTRGPEAPAPAVGSAQESELLTLSFFSMTRLGTALGIQNTRLVSLRTSLRHPGPSRTSSWGPAGLRELLSSTLLPLCVVINLDCLPDEL